MLAQTEGEDTPIPPIPGFNVDTALCALNITRTPFDELNGNIQGFVSGREIAVNPFAALPHKTTFHEIAHLCSRAHHIGKACGQRTDRTARPRG